MASLKEVKQRIASVQNTKKITEARQMISSAQLHRVQMVMEDAMAYRVSLESLFKNVASSNLPASHPFYEKKEGGAVAVVIMSSNSGMCGSFNTTMVKEVDAIKNRYANENLKLIPIGKKIREALQHMGEKCDYNFDEIMNKPSFEAVKEVSSLLTKLFLSGEASQVVLVYYHFRNIVKQKITYSTLLPMSFQSASQDQKNAWNDDYILEPSESEIIDYLLPKLIDAKFYTSILDNQMSEFGARTIAMQLASENANEMLDELQHAYNKIRQQNITFELLDIIGTSFA